LLFASLFESDILRFYFDDPMMIIAFSVREHSARF